MGSPVKFLFNDDFGLADRRKSVPLAEHTAKLAEAEACGYRNGFADANAAADALAGAALERIAGALERLGRTLSALEARVETEAVEVAVTVAKKLAPALIAREPFAEIAALTTTCFRQLVAAPHVVVRVDEQLQQVARKKLEDSIQASGFAGRLVVLAEPDIAPGDCRVEWADGGIKRDRATIEAAIDQAVTRYIAVRRSGPELPEISGRDQS